MKKYLLFLLFFCNLTFGKANYAYVPAKAKIKIGLSTLASFVLSSFILYQAGFLNEENEVSFVLSNTAIVFLSTGAFIVSLLTSKGVRLSLQIHFFLNRLNKKELYSDLEKKELTIEKLNEKFITSSTPLIDSFNKLIELREPLKMLSDNFKKMVEDHDCPNDIKTSAKIEFGKYEEYLNIVKSLIFQLKNDPDFSNQTLISTTKNYQKDQAVNFQILGMGVGMVLTIMMHYSKNFK